MEVYVDDITGNMFAMIDGKMFSVKARVKGQYTVKCVELGRIWSGCEIVAKRHACWKNGWQQFKSQDEHRAAEALEWK
jgi:hypothetical protein